MSKFKVGDRVVRVGCFDNDFIEMTKGVVLVVSDVDDCGDLSFGVKGGGWYAGYYELYKGNETMNTTTTANKAEAISRIEAIEKELQELKKVVEQEDKAEVDCLIASPVENHGEHFFIMDDDNSFSAESCGSYHQVGMHFADAEQCKLYAEALTTFILLRKQPGSEAAVSGKEQWTFQPEGATLESLYCNEYEYKICSISPWFSSEKAAYEAIKSLGAERILSMFKAFHS
jgi:hypothetical protein